MKRSACIVALAWLVAGVAAQPTTSPSGSEPHLTLVFIRAASCEACAAIDQTLQSLERDGELAGIELVRVDADAEPERVAQMQVNTTPTLRVVDHEMRVLASQSGPMDRAAILTLLRKAASIAHPPPGSAAEFFAAIASPNPRVRDAAIDWLATHRESATAAIERFASDARLQPRLALLEVFSRWNAPVEGLDPWQPETVTMERIAQLRAWVNGAATHPS